MASPRCSSGALLFICYASIARAQAPVTRRDSVRGDSSGARVSARVPWVTRRNGVAALAAAGATVLLAPLDRTISGELGEPRWQGNRTLQRTANNVAYFGGDGPFLISGLLYAGGLVTGIDPLASAAMHNLEATVLAAGITGFAKGVTGRALPTVQKGRGFSFGRGFHEGNGPFVSFPSGHTAAAFAMAATLSGEIGRLHPDLEPTVDHFAFAFAGAVGAARLVQRVHWPSDLPLAVLIGTWSGQAVQAHAYRHDLMSRITAGLTVSPAPDGRMNIGWSSMASRSAAR